MEFIPLGFMFFLGAVIASFATVVAERLHTGMSWMSGRSRCNSCGRTLSGVDLVPMVSWLISGGRCRVCGSRVPASYPLFELLTGSAFVLGFFILGFSYALPFYFATIAVLAFIVLYDLRHTVVPPLASLTLVVFSFATAISTTGSLQTFGSTLLTAGIIGMAFFLMHVLSRGKAMGLADTPVVFALSTLVAPYAVAGVLFSFWIGAVSGIAILLLRPGGPRMGIEVPFVPYLAAGYLLAYALQWNPLALLS